MFDLTPNLNEKQLKKMQKAIIKEVVKGMKSSVPFNDPSDFPNVSQKEWYMARLKAKACLIQLRVGPGAMREAKASLAATNLYPKERDRFLEAVATNDEDVIARCIFDTNMRDFDEQLFIAAMTVAVKEFAANNDKDWWELEPAQAAAIVYNSFTQYNNVARTH